MDPTAIIMAGPDGRITYWSPGATELFGYPPAEAVGAPLDLLVPPEYRDKHWQGFHQAMATGTSHLGGASANIPVRCRDGAVYAFPARLGLILDGHGKAVGAIGVYSARHGDEQPWTTV